jgi:hypothetical protein
MTNIPSAMTDVAPMGRVRPRALPPLHLRREVELELLDGAILSTLRKAPASTIFPRQPDWPAAAFGDAVKAIRLALRTMASPCPSSWAINLVRSAPLVCAAEGNAAARTTLDHSRCRVGGTLVCPSSNSKGA